MKNIGLSILLVIIFYGCNNKSGESTQEDNDNTYITPVNITEVEPETDAVTTATAKPNQVTFNGTIVIPPQHMATVTLTLGGVVKNTDLLPGRYIQKGTTLATLENPEFIELQQTWLESDAQLEYLEAEYKRQKALSAEQAASQKKYQQSKAEYLSMKSRVEASAAQLSLLGISTDELAKNGIQPLLTIKAPISGYISSVDINIGKYINPGEQLCEIIDKSQTMLRLTTYEKDLSEMAVNNSVEFRVNGIENQSFKATIISISQKVDEVSRSLDVFARVDDNNEQFRPGMYVTAQFMENK